MILAHLWKQLRRRLARLFLSFVVLAYLGIPVFMGVRRHGDPSGPKIYPARIHAALYGFGWFLAGHDDPPRALSADVERPWFYRLDESVNAGNAKEKVLDSVDRLRETVRAAQEAAGESTPESSAPVRGRRERE